MRKHRLRGVLIVWVVVATSACAAPVPIDQAMPTVRPAAASYEEYAVAACAAWDALFRAVGNPDTGTGSDLSRALDAAVAAGDGPSADRAAAAIAMELGTGRQQVAFAAGWVPRARVMAQVDRIFVAYEAMIAAKRAAPRHEPNAVDPQAAFEQAGGIEAYFAWIAALKEAGLTGAATERQCPKVPVAP